MPKSKLTKTYIDNLTAPEIGDTWHWDLELEGFGVRVQAGGRKTYVVRYRTRDGKRTQRKMTIARCSDLPPDRARDQARKVFSQVADGIDPALVLKRAQPSKATVGRMFQGYVDSLRNKGKVSHVEVERALLLSKNNAAKALGKDKAAAEVTPADVVAYVSGFYNAGYRGAADKHRSYIASAFAWAMRSAHDYTTTGGMDWGLTRNPGADVAKDQGAIKTRDRNLSVAELRLLWAATARGADGFSLETGAAIRLLICCGQRVQETLRLEGSEIDLEAALWTMPAHKTKGRKHKHVIPLPAQALDALQLLIDQHGTGPLFPARAGATSEKVPHQTVNQALGRWLAREDVNMEHFQSRDLRRTWKSRAHDAGVDRFTRDLIQQHAKNDTGSKNYDRSDYGPQMRAAMDKWSTWLAETIE